MTSDDKIVVENVNVPGRTTRVDRAMYEAMKAAMWKALPTQSPGLTQTEIREAVVQYLPEGLYPGGAKAGWWANDRPARPGSQGRDHPREYQTPALVQEEIKEAHNPCASFVLAKSYGVCESNAFFRAAMQLDILIWQTPLPGSRAAPSP